MQSYLFGFNFDKFSSLLVRAVFGVGLEDVPHEKTKEIIDISFGLFKSYIQKYLTQKYDIKDTLRTQAAFSSNFEDIFKKFPDLKPKFDEASRAFFKEMSDHPVFIES
jgi:hypothetical protein